MIKDTPLKKSEAEAAKHQCMTAFTKANHFNLRLNQRKHSRTYPSLKM